MQQCYALEGTSAGGLRGFILIATMGALPPETKGELNKI